MKERKKLNLKRVRRASRVRARVTGSAMRPRLAVSRSNRYLYVQLIDDVKGHTLAAVSSRGVKGAKSAQAFTAGEALAKKALEKGIKAAVFDRRSAKFHGRIKQFALGVQKGGLKI